MRGKRKFTVALIALAMGFILALPYLGVLNGNYVI